LEQSSSGWFEPAACFLKSLRQATLTASEGDETQKRDFLRKIGSNLSIENKTLRVQFRGAWQTLTDYGRIAQRNTAPLQSGAVCAVQFDQTAGMRRGGD